MTALIKLVQLFAGREWQPEVVTMRSPREIPPLAGRLFPDVRFLTGQEHSVITFPDELLCAAPRPFADREVAKLVSSPDDLVPGKPPASFADSLHQLLVPYLRDGHPPLELVAEVVGMSRRTLQRRLTEDDLSFSTLVDRARFEVATEMLRETDSTSIEVARAIGYQDSSHFARAFRRLAGCSPRQYRKMQVNLSPQC